MDKIIEKIPTWAICYLVNGDASGLTDEDIAMVDKYCERNRVSVVCPINDSVEEEMQPYFTPFPAFGLASDVIDCIVLIHP